MFSPPTISNDLQPHTLLSVLSGGVTGGAALNLTQPDTAGNEFYPFNPAMIFCFCDSEKSNP